MMMRYKFFGVAIACFVKTITCFSQDTKEYKWCNLADNSFRGIEGQAWQNEVKEKYRFPARAEKDPYACNGISGIDKKSGGTNKNTPARGNCFNYQEYYQERKRNKG